ncbi:MAG: GDSL-type esterase/lipase family protein [Phycisphaeraceae bacterium]
MHQSLHRLSILLIAMLCVTSAAPAAETSLAIPATDEGLAGDGPIVRDDWFQKLWLQRRTAWAGRVEKDRQAVVFLGDSITQGWGDNIKGTFGDLKVANRGISGDTTRGVLIRLQQDVLSLKPKAVVMLIGTNDLERGATPETVASNMKLILAALKKHDATMPIVLCAVMPSSASKNRPADKIKKVNALVADAVWGDKQVTFVDTWTLFADEKGDAIKAEFPDLLHPNDAGYAKWAAGIRPILATLGLVETGADDFKLEEGFESLFNGKDLTGWIIRANAKPGTKVVEPKHGAAGRPVFTEDIDLAGKTESPDGRYVALNGRLIVTTPVEGRRFQQVWTTREFPNDFTLKLDFRASPNADSGVFLRKPQLQCRDFLLAGPYNKLTKYNQGDWNELIVVVKGGVAHCTCNGEVLEAEFKLPATGPIGLEGDRGQMEYRRIRVKEMK